MKNRLLLPSSADPNVDQGELNALVGLLKTPSFTGLNQLHINLLAGKHEVATVATIRAHYMAARAGSWTNKRVQRLADKLGVSFKVLMALCGVFNPITIQGLRRRVGKGTWNIAFGIHFNAIEKAVNRSNNKGWTEAMLAGRNACLHREDRRTLIDI